jgi:uncharacterized protein YigE (DUF2233 family)
MADVSVSCSMTQRLPIWIKCFLGMVNSASCQAAAEHIEYEGALYHVYRIDKSQQTNLELVWLDTKGKPLSSFIGLHQESSAQGKTIQFAMNAGIYEHGPKPCGLTISAGKELVPLSLRDGEGNFYLKPNGVFYVDGKQGAGVMAANEYAASQLKPQIATQSGPLLLRHGKMHPAFNANSQNRRLRNAVGVRSADNQIIMVMSDREDRTKGRVTFHQLSRFFLHLGCQDALFLDGDISDMLVAP